MDLPWPSLTQRHAQPAAFLGAPHHLYLGWQGPALIEHDSAPQTLEMVVSYHPVDVHQIGPGDAVTGVE